MSLPQSSLSVDQGSRYQLTTATTDVRALQSPDGTTRRATTLYNSAQVRLHLSFPAAFSGNLHPYAVDWDSTRRRESITVHDGSGPRTANPSSAFDQVGRLTQTNVPAGP